MEIGEKATKVLFQTYSLFFLIGGTEKRDFSEQIS
jgi:hypothetical protein